MNLGENWINLRNLKSKCLLWSGHWAKCWKGKLSKTLSLAFYWPQTNIVQCDRLRDARKGGCAKLSDDCVAVIWLSSLPLSPTPLGTAGCPAGEEGCQDLACPLLAWGELLIRMVEAGDTTGDRAFDLGTSERVASGLPTSHSAQMSCFSQCWVCLTAES